MHSELNLNVLINVVFIVRTVVPLCAMHRMMANSFTLALMPIVNIDLHTNIENVRSESSKTTSQKHRLFPFANSITTNNNGQEFSLSHLSREIHYTQCILVSYWHYTHTHTYRSICATILSKIKITHTHFCAPSKHATQSRHDDKQKPFSFGWKSTCKLFVPIHNGFATTFKH